MCEQSWIFSVISVLTLLQNPHPSDFFSMNPPITIFVETKDNADIFLLAFEILPRIVHKAGPSSIEPVATKLHFNPTTPVTRKIGAAMATSKPKRQKRQHKTGQCPHKAMSVSTRAMGPAR
jgi:hypothetical protein